MFFPGLVLGIETSCDETSAAVLRGSDVLSSVVASQIDMHAKWGGVVPEAAARAHLESILPVIEEALQGKRPDAIAVTSRPGLVGALSVGVTAAKSLALSWDIPMIGVHHIEGHILSPLLAGVHCEFPGICLVVSGGHTESVAVRGLGDYEIVGQTLDDAAGEAFDKGARLMGLGYPGGRAIQEQAQFGTKGKYLLPQILKQDPLNFSFSGLKTAMLRLVEGESDRLDVPSAALALQDAIVGSLVKKSMAALDQVEFQNFFLVGGVAANQQLRNSLETECRRRGVRFTSPPIEYCTDNAAMIALAGSMRLARGERSNFELDCEPNSPLPPSIV